MAASLFSLQGCQGIQSTLAPHSADAAITFTIAQILIVAATGIFGFVMVLVAIAAFAPTPWRQRLKERPLIIGGGILFPVITLTALLFYVFSGTATMRAPAAPNGLVIEVIGYQWWWEVRYLKPNGELDFVTANELRIPVGRPVRVRLLAGDVIHSFWVPNLGGKLDMIPGHQNEMNLQADTAGVFRGQCAEYCGAQHAKMAFFVVASPATEFRRWQAAQRQPAAAPLSPDLMQGLRLFLEMGCGQCHRIRGTTADGHEGPDLTHVGSRYSLGAGILPNNVGSLAGWISSSQHLKPGSFMPAYPLAAPDLRAIAAYLESLQ